ncbi:unnamed protein product [Owenia fusiformis]|uniref:Uncharacterized protein n=1 Tax=Owenia fusiformis TaxID=6347 RepID=A0A8J1Y062_OWEFU|nr:unnamed protein product [Owenia fusiformis]
MSNEVYMKGDITVVANEMKKLVNNKEMSDIKFMIGPNRKPVYAHRCILSTRCDVFRAMFSDQESKSDKNNKEIPFVLSDITPDIFLAVMEYIYTGCVSLTGKIAIDVLGSSIEYGLDELRKLCNQYLVENLSINNACDAMQAAVTYGQDDLRAESMCYIEENTQNVFKSKSFHEMSEEALSVVLQSDRLMMDEPDVIDCVREWATVNSVVMGKSMSEVARKVVYHLRIPLLTPEELHALEEETRKDKLLPVELISFAWKCHALQKGERGNPLTTRRAGTTMRESHKGMDVL